jgi:hypothetical protein
MVFKIVILLALDSTFLSALADTDSTAKVSTLDAPDLAEYQNAPAPVRSLIDEGLALTKQNLSYKYGADDPAAGGMDCSGTIYYLLQHAGVKDVPRDASEIYKWVWQVSRFQAVVSSNPETFELARLKPGDLLFWTGTYSVERDPPVTHVMIYLGTSRLTGRRVMVGASDGRTFNDVPRYGVSVFDFKLPRGDKSAGDGGSRFIGYGAIPNLDNSAGPTAKNL